MDKTKRHSVVLIKLNVQFAMSDHLDPSISQGRSIAQESAAAVAGNSQGPLRSVAPPSIHQGVHTNAFPSNARGNIATKTAATGTASATATAVTSSTVTVKPQPTREDPLSQPIPLTSNRPPAPLASATAIPPPPPPHPYTAPSRVTQKSAPSNNSNSELSTSTKPKIANLTPEQEVDSFLSGPSKRTTLQEEPGPLPLLKPNPLPPNLTGIHQLKALVERRAWGDVVKMSAEMLMGGVSPYEKYYSQLVNGVSSKSPSNDVSVSVNVSVSNNNNKDDDSSQRQRQRQRQRQLISETVQILHWRIRALLFLRRYHDLKTEILRVRLLPSPSYTDTLPDWVPLGLILEGVETTFFVNMSLRGRDNNNDVSQGDDITEREDLDQLVDNLYNLRHGDMLANGKKYHTMKLDLVLTNILVRSEEWRLALHTLDGMLSYAEEAVKSWVGRKDINTIELGSDTVEAMVTAIKIELYSRQGKIFLQAGALPAAATVFEHAHDLFQATTFPSDMELSEISGMQDNDYQLVRNTKTQILINEGLLHFAHVDYDLAEEKFRLAVENQRNLRNLNNARATRDLILADGGLMDTEGDLLVPCLNNLALCALYTCRMRDAINIMEALVREDPTKYLTEVMVFNLCTLYELSSDNATSERKKRVLQSIAKRFTLHDIGPENFRLH